MASRSPHPRLALQQLEGREVPAFAIVNGTVIGGVLTLTGDDQGSNFVLRDTGNGMVVTANAGTLLLKDGEGVFEASKSFDDVTAVKLVLKGGDDTVTHDAAATLTLTGAFTADMGEGNNTLDLSIAPAAPSSIGRLDYKGLGGEDNIFIGEGNHTTAVAGTVSVSAGDGDNYVEINNATVAGDFTFAAKAGSDTITLFETVITKNVSAAFGTGRDSGEISVFGGRVTGNVTASAVGGNMTLTVEELAEVNGSTGVTLNAGANGSATVTLNESLLVPNGGVSLTGTNGVAMIDGPAGSLSAGKDVIPHAANNATSSNSWKLSVISVLSLSACVVASPAKVASMAARNEAKSGWYLP